MSSHEDLLQRFKAGYSALETAITGLAEAELHFHKAPGKWSIQEICLHLADTELAVAFRIRNILSEDNPALQPFDQDKWAAKLNYENHDLQLAMAQFQAVRQANAVLLASIQESDWQRTASHPSMGAITLERIVQIYTDHVYKHISQIEESLRLFHK